MVSSHSDPSGPTDFQIGRAYLDEVVIQLHEATSVIEHCVEQLDATQVWWRGNEQQNSIGTLIVHICGNIRQWILSGVGGDEDNRDRPLEFSGGREYVLPELIEMMAEMVDQSTVILNSLPCNKLLETKRIQGAERSLLSVIFDSISHWKAHSQEIVCLTRLQLGDRYRFRWVPATPEEGA